MKPAEFYQMQYEAAQQRLLLSSQSLHRLETLIPFALAAFYAWVWSQRLEDGLIYRTILFVPCGLVLVAFIRHSAEMEFVRRVAAYVSVIEDFLQKNADDMAEIGPGGFERFYLEGYSEHYVAEGKSDPFLKFRVAYWLTLAAGTAALFWFAPALWPPKTITDPVQIEIVNRSNSPLAKSPSGK